MHFVLFKNFFFMLHVADTLWLTLCDKVCQ